MNPVDTATPDRVVLIQELGQVLGADFPGAFRVFATRTPSSGRVRSSRVFPPRTADGHASGPARGFREPGAVVQPPGPRGPDEVPGAGCTAPGASRSPRFARKRGAWRPRRSRSGETPADSRASFSRSSVGLVVDLGSRAPGDWPGERTRGPWDRPGRWRRGSGPDFRSNVPRFPTPWWSSPGFRRECSVARQGALQGRFRVEPSGHAGGERGQALDIDSGQDTRAG